jgi:hypothetical protein
MIVRLVFIVYLLVIIGVIHLWHRFTVWFVREEGIVPGLFLCAALLLIACLPYWNAND